MIIGIDPGTEESALLIKPCVKCGESERYSNGACAPCARTRTKIKRNPTRHAETNLAWRKSHPVKWLEYQRKYRDNNREKLNKKQKERRAADPDRKQKDREYMRKYRYRGAFGVDGAELRAMRERQGNKCAICGTGLIDAHLDTHATVVRGTAVIDHMENENVKKVRGILCTNCNLGLGHFRDNPERLEAAAEYIRRSVE